ncbi:hypothetical protein GMRT_14184 [Giardia muris]|uniref:Uncharacterized protein n=1 Tax=Giardia muris TaxID=5742 RepID=A0A4Z1T3Q2_GIAMU|nr:hypothetical protein GMRT_14184 [Giardia muris]|eukprot:TNJ30278.1 hypothetical protein GMRT_14184 [Giardia muris]
MYIAQGVFRTLYIRNMVCFIHNLGSYGSVGSAIVPFLDQSVCYRVRTNEGAESQEYLFTVKEMSILHMVWVPRDILPPSLILDSRRYIPEADKWYGRIREVFGASRLSFVERVWQCYNPILGKGSGLGCTLKDVRASFNGYMSEHAQQLQVLKAVRALSQESTSPTITENLGLYQTIYTSISPTSHELVEIPHPDDILNTYCLVSWVNGIQTQCSWERIMTVPSGSIVLYNYFLQQNRLIHSLTIPRICSSFFCLRTVSTQHFISHMANKLACCNMPADHIPNRTPLLIHKAHVPYSFFVRTHTLIPIIADNFLLYNTFCQHIKKGIFNLLGSAWWVAPDVERGMSAGPAIVSRYFSFVKHIYKINSLSTPIMEGSPLTSPQTFAPMWLHSDQSSASIPPYIFQACLQDDPVPIYVRSDLPPTEEDLSSLSHAQPLFNNFLHFQPCDTPFIIVTTKESLTRWSHDLARHCSQNMTFVCDSSPITQAMFRKYFVVQSLDDLQDSDSIDDNVHDTESRSASRRQAERDWYLNITLPSAGLDGDIQGSPTPQRRACRCQYFEADWCRQCAPSYTPTIPHTPQMTTEENNSSCYQTRLDELQSTSIFHDGHSYYLTQNPIGDLITVRKTSMEEHYMEPSLKQEGSISSGTIHVLPNSKFPFSFLLIVDTEVPKLLDILTQIPFDCLVVDSPRTMAEGRFRGLSLYHNINAKHRILLTPVPFRIPCSDLLRNIPSDQSDASVIRRWMDSNLKAIGDLKDPEYEMAINVFSFLAQHIPQSAKKLLQDVGVSIRAAVAQDGGDTTRYTKLALYALLHYLDAECIPENCLKAVRFYEENTCKELAKRCEAANNEQDRSNNGMRNLFYWSARTTQVLNSSSFEANRDEFLRNTHDSLYNPKYYNFNEEPFAPFHEILARLHHLIRENPHEMSSADLTLSSLEPITAISSSSNIKQEPTQVSIEKDMDAYSPLELQLLDDFPENTPTEKDILQAELRMVLGSTHQTQSAFVLPLPQTLEQIIQQRSFLDSDGNVRLILFDDQKSLLLPSYQHTEIRSGVTRYSYPVYELCNQYCAFELLMLLWTERPLSLGDRYNLLAATVQETEHSKGLPPDQYTCQFSEIRAQYLSTVVNAFIAQYHDLHDMEEHYQHLSGRLGPVDAFLEVQRKRMAIVVPDVLYNATHAFLTGKYHEQAYIQDVRGYMQKIVIKDLFQRSNTDGALDIAAFTTLYRGLMLRLFQFLLGEEDTSEDQLPCISVIPESTILLLSVLLELSNPNVRKGKHLDELYSALQTYLVVFPVVSTRITEFLTTKLFLEFQYTFLPKLKPTLPFLLQLVARKTIEEQLLIMKQRATHAMYGEVVLLARHLYALTQAGELGKPRDLCYDALFTVIKNYLISTTPLSDANIGGQIKKAALEGGLGLKVTMSYFMDPVLRQTMSSWLDANLLIQGSLRVIYGNVRSSLRSYYAAVKPKRSTDPEDLNPSMAILDVSITRRQSKEMTPVKVLADVLPYFTYAGSNLTLQLQEEVGDPYSGLTLHAVSGNALISSPVTNNSIYLKTKKTGGLTGMTPSEALKYYFVMRYSKPAAIQAHGGTYLVQQPCTVPKFPAESTQGTRNVGMQDVVTVSQFHPTPHEKRYFLDGPPTLCSECGKTTSQDTEREKTGFCYICGRALQPYASSGDSLPGESLVYTLPSINATECVLPPSTIESQDAQVVGITSINGLISSNLCLSTYDGALLQEPLYARESTDTHLPSPIVISYIDTQLRRSLTNLHTVLKEVGGTTQFQEFYEERSLSYIAAVCSFYQATKFLSCASEYEPPYLDHMLSLGKSFSFIEHGLSYLLYGHTITDLVFNLFAALQKVLSRPLPFENPVFITELLENFLRWSATVRRKDTRALVTPLSASLLPLYNRFRNTRLSSLYGLFVPYAFYPTHYVLSTFCATTYPDIFSQSHLITSDTSLCVFVPHGEKGVPLASYSPATQCLIRWYLIYRDLITFATSADGEQGRNARVWEYDLRNAFLGFRALVSSTGSPCYGHTISTILSMLLSKEALHPVAPLNYTLKGEPWSSDFIQGGLFTSENIIADNTLVFALLTNIMSHASSFIGNGSLVAEDTHFVTLPECPHRALATFFYRTFETVNISLQHGFQDASFSQFFAQLCYQHRLIRSKVRVLSLTSPFSFHVSAGVQEQIREYLADPTASRLQRLFQYDYFWVYHFLRSHYLYDMPAINTLREEARHWSTDVVSLGFQVEEQYPGLQYVPASSLILETHPPSQACPNKLDPSDERPQSGEATSFRLDDAHVDSKGSSIPLADSDHLLREASLTFAIDAMILQRQGFLQYIALRNLRMMLVRNYPYGISPIPPFPRTVTIPASQALIASLGFDPTKVIPHLETVFSPQRVTPLPNFLTSELPFLPNERLCDWELNMNTPARSDIFTIDWQLKHLPSSPADTEIICFETDPCTGFPLSSHEDILATLRGEDKVANPIPKCASQIKQMMSSLEQCLDSMRKRRFVVDQLQRRGLTIGLTPAEVCGYLIPDRSREVAGQIIPLTDSQIMFATATFINLLWIFYQTKSPLPEELRSYTNAENAHVFLQQVNRIRSMNAKIKETFFLTRVLLTLVTSDMLALNCNVVFTPSFVEMAENRANQCLVPPSLEAMNQPLDALFRDLTATSQKLITVAWNHKYMYSPLPRSGIGGLNDPTKFHELHEYMRRAGPYVAAMDQFISFTDYLFKAFFSIEDTLEDRMKHPFSLIDQFTIFDYGLTNYRDILFRVCALKINFLSKVGLSQDTINEMHHDGLVTALQASIVITLARRIDQLWNRIMDFHLTQRTPINSRMNSLPSKHSSSTPVAFDPCHACDEISKFLDRVGNRIEITFGGASVNQPPILPTSTYAINSLPPKFKKLYMAYFKAIPSLGLETPLLSDHVIGFADSSGLLYKKVPTHDMIVCSVREIAAIPRLAEIRSKPTLLFQPTGKEFCSGRYRQIEEAIAIERVLQHDPYGQNTDDQELWGRIFQAFRNQAPSKARSIVMQAYSRMDVPTLPCYPSSRTLSDDLSGSLEHVDCLVPNTHSYTPTPLDLSYSRPTSSIPCVEPGTITQPLPSSIGDYGKMTSMAPISPSVGLLYSPLNTPMIPPIPPVGVGVSQLHYVHNPIQQRFSGLSPVLHPQVGYSGQIMQPLPMQVGMQMPSQASLSSRLSQHPSKPPYVYPPTSAGTVGEDPRFQYPKITHPSLLMPTTPSPPSKAPFSLSSFTEPIDVIRDGLTNIYPQLFKSTMDERAMEHELSKLLPDLSQPDIVPGTDAWNHLLEYAALARRPPKSPNNLELIRIDIRDALTKCVDETGASLSLSTIGDHYAQAKEEARAALTTAVTPYIDYLVEKGYLHAYELRKSIVNRKGVQEEHVTQLSNALKELSKFMSLQQLVVSRPEIRPQVVLMWVALHVCRRH